MREHRGNPVRCDDYYFHIEKVFFKVVEDFWWEEEGGDWGYPMRGEMLLLSF